MKKVIQRLKDIVLFLYWHPFKIIIQRIPFQFVYLFGRLSSILLLCFSRRKDYLKKESEYLVSKSNYSNYRIIYEQAFKIFCQNEFEVMLYPKLNQHNIKSIVRYKNLTYLDKCLSAGKGVILLFAHFGANQMIMPAIGHRGYKMNQLSARPTVWKELLRDKKFSSMQKNALDLRWEHDLSLPVKHIDVFGSLKEVFLCLKRNEILGIAIDGGGGNERVAVEFLGRRALFSTGAMRIAMKTDALVLPTFMVRNSKGCHDMIIEPPLKLAKRSGSKESVKKNIELFVKVLEEYVLKYPSHYLNFLALRRFMTEQGDTPFFI